MVQIADLQHDQWRMSIFKHQHAPLHIEQIHTELKQAFEARKYNDKACKQYAKFVLVQKTTYDFANVIAKIANYYR
jgi:hypothetical protein